MRVETSRGNEITNIEDWAKLYDTPQSSRQWKVGRSAHSTAEFFLNKTELKFFKTVFQKQ